jgi:hypothetical protein
MVKLFLGTTSVIQRSIKLAAFCAVLLYAATASAIVGDTEGIFGVDASIRNNLFATYSPDLAFTDADDNDRASGVAKRLLRMLASTPNMPSVSPTIAEAVAA